jgi:hypothetical protein
MVCSSGTLLTVQVQGLTVQVQGSQSRYRVQLNNTGTGLTVQVQGAHSPGTGSQFRNWGSKFRY